jgi:hypothetical protein
MIDDNSSNSSSSSIKELELEFGQLGQSEFSSSSSSSTMPLLFELILENEWEELRKNLQSTEGRTLCQQKDRSGLTCLAVALVHGAPLEVIEDLLATDPSLPRIRDEYGATALHIGCLNGAPLESIAVIIESYSDLAKELDIDQRAPLHHAIEHACGEEDDNDDDDIDENANNNNSSNSNENTSTSDQDNFNVELIRRLCEAAPETVHAFDDAGHTPIDMIQLVKVELDVKSEQYKKYHRLYQIMRMTSIKEYRKNKELWEMEAMLLRQHLAKEKERSNTTPSSSQSCNSKDGNNSMGSCTSYSSLVTPQSGGTSSVMMNLSVLQENDDHGQTTAMDVDNNNHNNFKPAVKEKDDSSGYGC